ncbi:DUF6268 family outer membrane beta-barrel protein [Flavobacterium sp. 17A]|uniref:DUF6268 family outer membrane beta-barrel protein n=1 Tax=Flavobacterium potami TaxID=2872310 RepID=A0A9X1HE69_9FLAO|nr:DUF6268 family outer membrane beta-barrel protein [Flavobacterium potami]MBZ4037003.1 DUF6268 family outer membrane beta-barrel protein [Flavobacterium potami]
MKSKIISFAFVFSTLNIVAQEKEPGVKTFAKAVVDKFPNTRTFDVQYEALGPSDYDSKLFGNKLERGRIEEHNRFKAAFNLPFYASKSKRFVLTTSVRYKYENFGYGDIFNYQTNQTYTKDNQEIHYWAGALTATYMSTLFKKPVIYNATTTVDGDEENFQRLKGFVSGVLVLKRTPSTTITAGALILLDPSSIVPVTPLFSINHKFKNSKWDMDFILPQRVLFRRELLENGRISLGTELNTESFYLNLDGSNLKGVYELNQLELKSGITYEYSFTPKLIAFVKGGFNNVVSARLTEKGERTNRYVYDQKEDTQGYFRFGISYNLFNKN